MADKSISELTAAEYITNTDLFVLEQSGAAKKLTGQILVNWLTDYADGHGGIQSIAKTGTSNLVDTYTITFADETTFSFNVTNGRTFTGVTQYWAVSSSNSTVPEQWSATRQTMTTENKYLWSYLHFTCNDGVDFDTVKSVIGVYGDTGEKTYVWIMYSASEPVRDSDMSNVPDKWIGIYTGTASSAPSSYQAYTWYEYKGAKGDQGDAATLSSSSVAYAQSQNGETVPSTGWGSTIPTPQAGYYLWTRTTIAFNSGDPIVSYSVARYGIDGSGAISTVNDLLPDGNGNVEVDADHILCDDDSSVQTHIDSIEDDIYAITNTRVQPIAQGGTGGETPAWARFNLGLSAQIANNVQIGSKVGTYQARFTYCAQNVIELFISGLNTGIATADVIGVLPSGYRPTADYALIPVYRYGRPYECVGTIWIGANGNMQIYFDGTPGYAFGTYIAGATPNT